MPISRSATTPTTLAFTTALSCPTPRRAIQAALIAADPRAGRKRTGVRLPGEHRQHDRRVRHRPGAGRGQSHQRHARDGHRRWPISRWASRAWTLPTWAASTQLVETVGAGGITMNFGDASTGTSAADLHGANASLALLDSPTINVIPAPAAAPTRP